MLRWETVKQHFAASGGKLCAGYRKRGARNERTAHRMGKKSKVVEIDVFRQVQELAAYQVLTGSRERRTHDERGESEERRACAAHI